MFFKNLKKKKQFRNFKEKMKMKRLTSGSASLGGKPTTKTRFF